MPLSEYAYCVAFAFQMTEGVEQWICIIFYVKLRHSSVETIQMIQKATAIGNWWQSFLAKHQISQVTQPSYSSDLVPCDFWLFPKLNHLWKGRDFRLLMRFRKLWQGSWWRLGELYEVPKCLSFEGDWGIIVLCTMFLVSSSINVSIFHSAWLDTFWTDLI